MPNLLCCGDNLDILRRYIADGSQDYNVLFAEQDGTRSAVKIKVFEDTWDCVSRGN